MLLFSEGWGMLNQLKKGKRQGWREEGKKGGREERQRKRKKMAKAEDKGGFKKKIHPQL